MMMTGVVTPLRRMVWMTSNPSMSPSVMSIRIISSVLLCRAMRSSAAAPLLTTRGSISLLIITFDKKFANCWIVVYNKNMIRHDNSLHFSDRKNLFHLR